MKRPPRRAHDIAIDRIVLPHGTISTRRVRAAIERELTRLLSEQPAQAGTAMPAAKVKAGADADADAVGVAVARQVHEATKTKAAT